MNRGVKYFGEYLRGVRKRAGHTQVSAAHDLEITSNVLSAWETGIRYPSITRMPDIISLYGIDEKELSEAFAEAKAMDARERFSDILNMARNLREVTA